MKNKITAGIPHPSCAALTARPRRLGIDTHQELVAYLRSDSCICRSEGFDAQSRVELRLNENSIIATLNIVHGDILTADEVGLSESAWLRLAPKENDIVRFAHPQAIDSMSFVRAKIYGQTLSEAQLDAIIRDIVAGHFSDVELSAFIAGCAGDHLDASEIIALTRAMIHAGNRLIWPHDRVVDKHCVGGLPGNRTTPIIVPIVAALGLVMPKTSSRAITSPAGTADTMAMLAPVNLSLAAMRQVVEAEGGCIVWGGAMDISPADDILIRVERALDIDSEGQLVASILSKKAAAGSTHVVLDIPVGPTAKVRSLAEAQSLMASLKHTADAIGIRLQTIITDGMQPVGYGVGPALEAHDVLAVLQNRPDAPEDLRQRAIDIAATVIELAGLAQGAAAQALVATVLADGRAWTKFQAICIAQGGMREPGYAAQTRPVCAHSAGRVTAIDNRLLSRAAKLAGAPHAALAGLTMQVRIGDHVEHGQPLFTLHAETPGELDYVFDFVLRHPGIVHLELS